MVSWAKFHFSLAFLSYRPDHLLLLRFGVKKIDDHRDDRLPAVHQGNVSCVRQNSQSRFRTRLHGLKLQLEAVLQGLKWGFSSTILMVVVHAIILHQNSDRDGISLEVDF